MVTLNPMVVDTGSPPIPEAYRWTERYDGAKGPLILLSQAAPSAPPHTELVDRIARAAASAETARYGDICGDAALRTAYADEVGRIHDADIGAGHVAITAGCNLGFIVAAMAVARAGDVVMLPSPWYFNHKMSLDMLGIEARELPCEPDDGFVPDARSAAWLLDARVKAIVLVTPNNPTGAVYPPATIQAFSDLCRSRGITLILDETYRDFLPRSAEPPHRVAGGVWPDHLVQLYSFSKAFHIPGYRLGAMVAAPRVIGEIAKLLDCLQICAPRIAQEPVAWALTGLRRWRAENRERIAALGSAFAAAIEPLAGWRLLSIGSYFAYVEHPCPEATSADVAERLAVEQGVLGLPASYFGPGQERFLRLAFANIDVTQVADIAARLTGFSPHVAGPRQLIERLAKVGLQP